MADTGLTFLLSVDEGGAVYNTLGGQRSTGFERTTDEADATDKDSGEWHEGIPTTRNWVFNADGVLEEGDTAYGDLEDAWMNNVQISVRITTPGGSTYTGTATVTQLNLDGPYDDVLSYSVTLQGTAALVKA